MYEFDNYTDRRNTNSLKWNVEEKELPMWVADMDFQVAPEIQEAIKNKVEHGIFGYSVVSDVWYQAYREWWKKRHHFAIEREWMLFCAGVVPAISSMVRKLTTPAEKIVLITPVYNIFFNCIQNNGRRVAESPLQYDGTQYAIDFAQLEQTLADPQTSLMILCNPHNPIGMVWDKDTLEKIGDLCHRYHVIVVADEIHCDLTEQNCHYTPFASVSKICKEQSITCLSPTKAFNLAGLQTAAVVIPNETLRYKVLRAFATDEIAEPNTFAVEAAVAAFTKGEVWLEELREYLSQNKKIVEDYVKKEISNLKVVPSKATYLIWLDCTKIIGNTSEMANFIRNKTGLYLSEGKQYGANGQNFLRINIACPRCTLKDGLERLKQGIKEYKKWSANLC